MSTPPNQGGACRQAQQAAPASCSSCGLQLRFARGAHQLPICWDGFKKLGLHALQDRVLLSRRTPQGFRAYADTLMRTCLHSAVHASHAAGEAVSKGIGTKQRQAGRYMLGGSSGGEMGHADACVPLPPPAAMGAKGEEAAK